MSSKQLVYERVIEMTAVMMGIYMGIAGCIVYYCNLLSVR